MPLPRWVARFNKRVTNRFLEPLARRFNNFAVVNHVGRRSGRPYRTPVNYFETDEVGTVVVALTYGPGADWVRNVQGRGGTVETVHGVGRIESAEIVDRLGAWPLLPRLVRVVLRLLRVRHFMMLRLEPNTSQ